MSKLRDFFVGLPAACGVEPEAAKMLGKQLGELFDFEVDHPESIFSAKSGQHIEDRMYPAVAHWMMFADDDKFDYAHDLLIYAARCHAINAKGASFKGIEDDRFSLETDEPNFPEISALLTVSEASTLSNWI